MSEYTAELYVHAIAIELEAARRYAELAQAMSAQGNHAVAELFRNGTDPVEIIKWKDIYGLLEDAIDACEDVANVIERIVVKHA